MKKAIIPHFGPIKLVGITARTSNLLERSSLTAKIGPTIQNYFHNGLANKISNRKNPGTTYCVYTDYESDFNGEYTYFVGEEVTEFSDIPHGFEQLTIPVQNYNKFTVGPGRMPQICINAWEKIWGMPEVELGGVRNYIADFEVYDERSSDLQNAIFDIYIGV